MAKVQPLGSKLETDKAVKEITEELERWQKLKSDYSLSLDRKGDAWLEHVRHGRRSTAQLIRKIFPSSKEEEKFHNAFVEFFTDDPQIESTMENVIQNLTELLESLTHPNYTSTGTVDHKRRPKKNILIDLLQKVGSYFSAH